MRRHAGLAGSSGRESGAKPSAARRDEASIASERRRQLNCAASTPS